MEKVAKFFCDHIDVIYSYRPGEGIAQPFEVFIINIPLMETVVGKIK